MRQLTALFVVSAIAAGCGRSPTSPSPPVEPPPISPPPSPAPTPKLSVTRVLAFGDSMTEGTVNPALHSALSAGIPQSYPYKLQERLSRVYSTQTMVVLNGGVGGERTADGAKRLPDVMREAQPEVVLLMEGVNDLNNGAGINSTIDRLESMIQYARSRGAYVFLATLPPQRPGGLRAKSVDLIPRFNDEIRRTAADDGATLVDVNAVFDIALIGQDGLHPTEPGYARLSEIFFDAIRKAFEPTEARPAAPSYREFPGRVH